MTAKRRRRPKTTPVPAKVTKPAKDGDSPQSSGPAGARALPRPTDALMLDVAAEGGRGLNNFDVLRLFAAGLVVFTHTFQVVGKPEPIPGALGMDYGQFGVLIFFSISGFLVARSWSYDPKVLSFAMRRALRLLPALIVSLLLTALVLGPLLSTVSFSAYMQDVKTKYYVLFHLLMQQDLQLPGVFQDIPYKGIVNAPLWTLQLEVKAYVLIAIIGVLGFFRRGPWWILILAVLCGLFLVNPIRNEIPLANQLVTLTQDLQIGDVWLKEARTGQLFFIFQPFAAFVIGAMLYRIRSWVPLSWWLFGLAVGAWLATVFFGDPQASRIAITWVMPYIVLVLAYRTHRYFGLPSRMGDYSYGIYIYAFPIQQVVVQLFDVTSPWLGLVYSVPVTAVLAVLSWHFIEAPSLTLKSGLAGYLDREADSARAHPAGREQLAPAGAPASG